MVVNCSFLEALEVFISYLAVLVTFTETFLWVFGPLSIEASPIPYGEFFNLTHICAYLVLFGMLLKENILESQMTPSQYFHMIYI